MPEAEAERAGAAPPEEPPREELPLVPSESSYESPEKELGSVTTVLPCSGWKRPLLLLVWPSPPLGVRPDSAEDEVLPATMPAACDDEAAWLLFLPIEPNLFSIDFHFLSRLPLMLGFGDTGAVPLEMLRSRVELLAPGERWCAGEWSPCR